MKKIVKFLMLFPIITLVTLGCANVAPDDAEVTINPDKIDLSDTIDDFVNQQFVITVKDKNGNPLNAVEITISFIFAPDYSCPVGNCVRSVQLVDKDGNDVSSPFTTTTDTDGTYIITLRLYAKGKAYKGNLEVRAGATGFKSVEVKVNAS